MLVGFDVLPISLKDGDKPVLHDDFIGRDT